MFKNKNYEVTAYKDFDFSRVKIAIFAEVSESEVELSVNAGKSGAVVITSQPAFRHARDIPLLVAGVNDEVTGDYQQHNIIAVPDSTSILCLRAIKAISDHHAIERVSMVSCQAVSEDGDSGVNELAGQTARLLNAMPIEETFFPKQIAFNMIPQYGDLLEDGSTRAESEQSTAIEKILQQPGMQVDSTIHSVPVFYGHTVSLDIRLRDAANVDAIFQGWKQQNDLEYVVNDIPTPVTIASMDEKVMVHRLRISGEVQQYLRFSVVADNIRTGSANNFVKIAENLISGYL